MRTAELVARIEALQEIQKRNRPTSAAWRKAHRTLQPLFSEMARRQKANGGAKDWRTWTEVP